MTLYWKGKPEDCPLGYVPYNTHFGIVGNPNSEEMKLAEPTSMGELMKKNIMSQIAGEPPAHLKAYLHVIESAKPRYDPKRAAEILKMWMG